MQREKTILVKCLFFPDEFPPKCLAPVSYRQGKVLEEIGLNLSSVAMESKHIAILCGNTIQRVSKQYMQHKKKNPNTADLYGKATC